MQQVSIYKSRSAHPQSSGHGYASDFKRLLIGLAMISSVAIAFSASAQEMVLHGPQEAANFAGEPSASGSRALVLLSHGEGTVRVIRVWYPPNVELPPHGAMQEGQAAIVTVLAGDMKLAMGSEYDESRLETLPVGGAFVLTHENAAHFAKTGAAGAQLLLVVGPEKELNTAMIGRE